MEIGRGRRGEGKGAELEVCGAAYAEDGWGCWETAGKRGWYGEGGGGRREEKSGIGQIVGPMLGMGW
jgi:hypothetical protein